MPPCTRSVAGEEMRRKDGKDLPPVQYIPFPSELEGTAPMLAAGFRQYGGDSDFMKRMR